MPPPTNSIKRSSNGSKSILARDAENAGIKTIVVGMHQALPDSISYGPQHERVADWHGKRAPRL